MLALGWVSLLTDLSSEMIVPLLPAFVAALGSGPAFLSLLEGAANATVAVLKGCSGAWSDRTRTRKGWVLAGYGLSSVARPLLSLAAGPWTVLGIRVADRVGKGLRTAPRDAMLSASVRPQERGAAFGTQRAMDHTGALGGTLLAALLVGLGCGERAVFAWAAIPAALAVVVLLAFVREPAAAEPNPSNAAPARTRGFRPFLIVASLSGLGSGLDLLLLYRVLEVGMPGWSAPLLWGLLHVVRSTLTAPLGVLSDRVDRRTVIGAGLTVQAAILAAFGLAEAPGLVVLLFALHGLHAAFTEGAERGLVADLTGGRRGGRAFGAYHMVTGLAGLPLLLGVGALYEGVGAGAAFPAAALLSVAALIILWLAVPRPPARQPGV